MPCKEMWGRKYPPANQKQKPLTLKQTKPRKTRKSKGKKR